MTLTSITKIQRKPAYDKRTGKKYEYHVIAIPRAISEDSQYPFNVGEKVKISVEPNKKKIIIVKLKESAPKRKKG
ncbi:MAG: hypothetical protein LZ158_01735 [Thaumarchaeota archaeon]|nr:hypothetical protein [Candidatus Terraquivivens yellowstonensis]MCL7387304.1 hypothetical protein [Candidatus Terraquivivens yellowstonensis]MCL7392427.1 hypothetical protein [Candidatus Terraquivivens yellowstonensis]MCL7394720.1 hypothetical protein [Candidatus Terraquivivens yellowstonensis]MCL7397603.1 hypothetical protein [Candidatus Terraquivivens yellowstonensis]